MAEQHIVGDRIIVIPPDIEAQGREAIMRYLRDQGVAQLERTHPVDREDEGVNDNG